MRRLVCAMLVATLMFGTTTSPVFAMDDMPMPSTPPTMPAGPMEPDDDMPPMPTDPSMPSTMPTDPSMPSTMPPGPMEPDDGMPPMPTDPSMPSTMPTDPSMPPTMPMPPATTPHVVRDSGRDRVEAAVAISARQFEAGSVREAVLVNGYAYTDAVTAPALAGALESPVLVSRANGVTTSVIDELDRLGAERVYLIGGTATLSTRVRTQLVQAGFEVSRVYGADRYTTAAAVAKKVLSITGDVQRAFIVNADTPHSAVAAAPYAYSQGIPVLFTSATGVPSATSSAITKLGIDNVTVVGGTASVSKASYASLSKRTTGGADNRIGGATRFENTTLLAEYALARGWAEPMHVGLFNGVKGFSDALAGGAAVGAQDGVLLMVTTTELPRATEQFLMMHLEAAEIDAIHLFGGTSSISDSVKHMVSGLIGGSHTPAPTDPAPSH